MGRYKEIRQKIESIKKVAHTYGARRNGCELLKTVHATGQTTWYMISPWTGIHAIQTDGPEISERVKAHWDGFVENNSIENLT